MTRAPQASGAGAPRAVVFAYHDVGVRCLRTLLSHGVDVPLVFTHPDAPGETIWFDSVARHAAWHGLDVQLAPDPNVPAMRELIASARPDFIFSFYYRSMLSESLLGLARRGAYNMHGSLLPKYRGRVPVNWAVVNGERETGATLHTMVARPDAGDIVAQQAVPILPDDTAIEVFRKVTVAAELALDRSLPALLAGTAVHTPQDLSQGSYFGRRTAADGVIDWDKGVEAVHNLVRAVAPPYPGAYTHADDRPLRILRSLPRALMPRHARPAVYWHNGTVLADCRDGVLQLLEFEFADGITDAAAWQRACGERALPLTSTMG